MEIMKSNTRLKEAVNDWVEFYTSIDYNCNRAQHYENEIFEAAIEAYCEMSWDELNKMNEKAEKEKERRKNRRLIFGEDVNDEEWTGDDIDDYGDR